jgi:fructosamine-3-kinase
VHLPAAIRTSVEETLREHTGREGGITSVQRVGGGCISPSARIERAGREYWFLKWSDDAAPADFFREEARSLRALRATGTVRVPEVIDVAESWLLLEWLEPGGGIERSWQNLGADLAALHRATASTFGWEFDNYIGSLPQRNHREQDWAAFWRDQRLLPQLDHAIAAGNLTVAERKRFDDFLARLDAILAAGSADGPSLLHGDLWSGNVHMMADSAALVDPSSCYGHREVDLAMAQLFGGFPGDFFSAYREAWPLQPGYAEQRRDAYQLYYLLVHVNIFGRSYVPQALSVLQR